MSIFLTTSQVALLAAGLFIFLVWIYFRIKRKILKEKLSSFSFALASSLEAMLITFPDLGSRIDWYAHRLSSLNGSFKADEVNVLLRAIVLLMSLKALVEKQTNTKGASLIDAGGENLRFLGLSILGCNLTKDTLSQELADICVKACLDAEKSIIPLEQVSTELFKSGLAGENGIRFSTKNLFVARMICERRILDVYASSLDIHLFDEPGAPTSFNDLWPSPTDTGMALSKRFLDD